jgi:hypothetical protein
LLLAPAGHGADAASNRAIARRASRLRFALDYAEPDMPVLKTETLAYSTERLSRTKSKERRAGVFVQLLALALDRSPDRMEETAMAYIDWSLQGHSIANCNCDFGCPCQFNTLPTHGDCRAMTAVKIDKGHFGDVDLSGLAFCGIFAWPGAIHFGNGEAFVVISEHATEAQRNALLTILSGKETVPGATIFNVFAPTFAKMHDPVFAPIEFYLDLDNRIGRVRIPGIIDTSIEPIRNPVTGKGHRVSVHLPEGFEYHQAEYASGSTRADGPIKLTLANSHSHVYDLHMTTNGVV